MEKRQDRLLTSVPDDGNDIPTLKPIIPGETVVPHGKW